MEKKIDAMIEELKRYRNNNVKNNARHFCRILEFANLLSSMITFEGQKDKSELLPYYQSGDIFVFPSKKEGMSNAVLEAMACGLPIVMSPCQGSSELIDGNGVISDPDLTKFKKTLIDAISAGNEELKRMSDCSRQRAQNLFSWKSVAERYMFLFESIRSGGKS